MIIQTKFDVGQIIYRMTVSRVIEERPCRVCGGASTVATIAEDGSEHRVRCPKRTYTFRDPENDICHGGKVLIGTRHERGSPQRLTVGQVQVRVGALPEETVMCQETGVGSGMCHPVEPEPVTYTSRGNHYGVFHTPDDACAWGDDVVRMCNALLGVELEHDEALELYKIYDAHAEALTMAEEAS